MQASCSHILRLRQERYNACRTPGEGDCEHKIAAPIAVRDAQPLVFRLDYTLRTRGHPWLYDRQQWHQLTHFASRLQIAEEANGIRHISTCEFFLSFLLLNGMHRFCDAIPSCDRGGLITTQVESFVRAWRSFESVCGSPSLLQEEGVATQKCVWVSRYGLKGFPTLTRPIVLPNAKAVQEFLDASANDLVQLRDSLPGDTYGWWKWWAPGLHDSQMHTSGDLPMYPLAGKAPRRIKTKLAPPWRQQQLEFRTLWQRLSECPIMNEHVGGRDVREYVWDYGVLSRNDLRSMSLALRKRAERANALIILNQAASKKRHHVAHTTLTVRAECHRCGRIGWLSHRSSWYVGGCSGVGAYDIQTANTSLAQQAATAEQLASRITALKRFLPLL